MMGCRNLPMAVAGLLLTPFAAQAQKRGRCGGSRCSEGRMAPARPTPCTRGHFKTCLGLQCPSRDPHKTRAFGAGLSPDLGFEMTSR